jgi:hypothetical protein
MQKHKNNNTKSNVLVAIAIILITVSVIGLLSSKPIKDTPYNLNIKGETATKAFQFEQSSPSASLNVLSSTTSALEEFASPTGTPTPTPQTSFRHSKLGFSFDIPKGGTAIETDPSNIILVANSSGGAFVEIPNALQIEIAIVQLNSMNLFQYYHNRLATMFDDKILSFQEASPSASLKGYEIQLKNEESKQNKTLLFLNFRGSQIFEIEAVYLKPNHKKEEEIVKTLISSLKPY